MNDSKNLVIASFKDILEFMLPTLTFSEDVILPYDSMAIKSHGLESKINDEGNIILEAGSYSNDYYNDTYTGFFCITENGNKKKIHLGVDISYGYDCPLSCIHAPVYSPVTGLIEKGFDVAIFNCSQQLKINAGVILATLAQEQGWCKNGKYEKAFGVGPGGNPKIFSDFEKGGIFKSVNTYIKWFNIGKKNNGKELHVNLDKSPYKETNAVFQDKTKAWQKSNQKYVKYMEEGIKIIPVNAVMYAKLKYTPWIDFPPQNSKPLQQCHDIYINLK